jgi:hypothetical protein
MNNNLEFRFSKHDLLLHGLIAAFCCDVVTKVWNAQSCEGEVSVSWCHLLSTLVRLTFPVDMVDGYWYKNTEHSWVETRSGHIIDVSPIGCRSMAVMLPGVPLKKDCINWRNVFTKATKKEREGFILLRKSKKFGTALEDAFIKTKRLRNRYTKMYLRYCKENNIKPLKQWVA